MNTNAYHNKHIEFVYNGKPVKIYESDCNWSKCAVIRNGKVYGYGDTMFKAWIDACDTAYNECDYFDPMAILCLTHTKEEAERIMDWSDDEYLEEVCEIMNSKPENSCEVLRGGDYRTIDWEIEGTEED